MLTDKSPDFLHENNGDTIFLYEILWDNEIDADITWVDRIHAWKLDMGRVEDPMLAMAEVFIAFTAAGLAVAPVSYVASENGEYLAIFFRVLAIPNEMFAPDHPQESFETWLNQVDRWLLKHTGMSYHDLPDNWQVRDAYNDGTSAQEMGARIYDEMWELVPV